MARTLLDRGISLVTGGTDNHLMLIDLSDAPLSGKDAEDLLVRAGITVNKNTVPGERRSPFVTSGVRIGSPAMTTRGLGREESALVASWIADLLQSPQDAAVFARVRADVHDLCRRFPIYPGLTA